MYKLLMQIESWIILLLVRFSAKIEEQFANHNFGYVIVVGGLFPSPILHLLEGI